ncbi:MAG: LysR substrate-binding domain-containing protein, partial [Shewanella sp.]
DKLTIVCGATHSLAHQIVTSTQLSQEVWYFDESQTITRTRAIQLLSSVNVLPSQEITMGTLGAIKRATATGYGVSILPYIAIDAELARGDLVELQLPGWDFERNYWVIQRADEPASTLAINFMQYWAENKLRLNSALAI